MKPMITDWLMVVITTIYVIATICITKSNKDSASASREQLKESIRQKQMIEISKLLERETYLQKTIIEKRNQIVNQILINELNK